MSTHVHIDLYEVLREVGASEERARAGASNILVTDNLATKEDVGAVKTEIATLRGEARTPKVGALHVRPTHPRLAQQAGVLPLAPIRRGGDMT